MKVVAISALNLRRLFRDRNNVFFVLIMPFLMIFVIGLLFGGSRQLNVGLTGDGEGPLAGRLATALAAEGRISVVRFDSEADLRTAVERGGVEAGVVIPAGYDSELRAGRDVAVRYLSRPTDQRALDAGTWVRSVVSQEAAVIRGARFGAAEGAGTFDESLAAADNAVVPGIDVEVTTSGRAVFPPGFNQFSVSAPPLLLLFIFLTSLSAAVGLIETRRLGVSRRIYSTPTSTRTIIAGEALGRILIALTQGLIIMFGSAVLYGVAWGDPLGAAALLTLFALVGSGAAMLLGAALRTESSALAAAPLIGLGVAALGGTMIPLEQFSESMKTVAHLTPHTWAYEGFAELIRHDAGVAGILPQLGVLAAFAAVLFTLGVWRLRRALIH